MTFNKLLLGACVCGMLALLCVSSWAQTPPAGTTTPPAASSTTPPGGTTGGTTPPLSTGTSTGTPSSNGPKWSPEVDGVTGSRQLSPTGDILDSNMDALAPLALDPINIPEVNLTVKNLLEPQKAAEIIKKALYLPLDKDERARLTQDQVLKIRRNQRTVLQQTVSHALAFGVTTAQNVSDFSKRKDTAATFIPSTENQREDMQVLTGLTLGQLAETNKMLALTATLGLLEASDSLAASSTLIGD